MACQRVFIGNGCFPLGHTDLNACGKLHVNLPARILYPYKKGGLFFIFVLFEKIKSGKFFLS